MIKRFKPKKLHEQESQTIEDPVLYELHKIYRTEGRGIERVSNPFDPQDSNVFRHVSEAHPTIPTPAQIQRAIRGQS